jgi:hypothetical protein
MKIFSNRVHGVLDYVTVAIFAAAPGVLGFEGLPEGLCYSLAVVHLMMTLATDFEMGLWKVIPIAVHKWVETAVGPLLIALPWIVNLLALERIFFISMGFVIVLVRALSSYSGRES